MNSGIAWTILIASLLVLIPSQVNKSRSIDEEIRRLNTEEVDALLKGNVRKLEDLWSDNLVVTNPLNQFVNKQKVIELVQSGTLTFVSYERHIEYIRRYHDTVVVAGNESVVWGERMPNAGKMSRLRFTAIWIKQDGRWQEVARHANIVPE